MASFARQSAQCIIGALDSEGGRYTDPDGRMFVNTPTGAMTPVRIDISRLSPMSLESVATQLKQCIEEYLGMRESLRPTGRHYLLADSERSRTLAALVHEQWKQDHAKSELVFVPEQCTGLKGEAYVIADAVRTGRSTALTVQQARQAGADVKAVFSVFNYQFGGEETMKEAFGDKAPAMYAIVGRNDSLFIHRYARLTHEVAARQSSERRLIMQATWKYLRAPLPSEVNYLFDVLCLKSLPLEQAIVPTDNNGRPDTHRIALERAVLRLSVETALHSPSQEGYFMPPEKEAELIAFLRERMDTVRKTARKQYAPEATWLDGLGPAIDKAVAAAKERMMPLNGFGPAHVRNVRTFFQLLALQEHNIPHNVYGLFCWPPDHVDVNEKPSLFAMFNR